MRRNGLLLIAPVVTALLLLWGCEPSDPGSPIANQPPTVRIVVAPLDSALHDHYISPSVMFHIQWFGNDVDGEVVGYYLQVDDGPEAWTTKGDSAIAFRASEPDSTQPEKTVPTWHTVRVTALDNEDLRSAPAERTFRVTNWFPEITAFVADFPDSALVGPGISFSVEWSDQNYSGGEFQLLLDGEAITDWDARSGYQFCDMSDPTILELLDETEVQAVDCALLTSGEHDIGVVVRDRGDARSQPWMRHITVADTFKPMLESISSLYGSSDYYPDGSIFHRARTTTSFTMNGSAEEYFGGVHSFRHRYRYREIPQTPEDTTWGDWNDWSDWGGSEFEMANLPVGEYHFQAQCRDWAAFESLVTDYFMTIVEANFEEKTLLIVDETKDGNGRPGSPNDEQCDRFYREILGLDTTTWTTPDGWTVSEIDYRNHKIGDASYVSPKDVCNQRVIIWHSDDKSELRLSDNTRILQEYLDRGGRLIVSGWDVLSPFADGDEVTFTSGFAYRYLRIAAAKRENDKLFVGMTGDAELGYPDLELDREKVPGRWNGLDKCWLLEPRHRTDSIGGWRGFEGRPPDFEGRGCAVRNFAPVNPWRTIVLGFPLYFMGTDQAVQFIRTAIADIDG